MRTRIVSEFVTMDGVMEAPGGEPTHPHSGWVMDFEGPEQTAYKLEEVLDAELLLIGPVTYDSFAGAWPNYTGVFADKMNGMPKVVVSSTLADPAWDNTSVLTGEVVQGVTELKAQAGGPILVAGSKALVHTLLENDLVDELRLMVFPVTIGSGLRVFPETTKKTPWTMTGSQAFPSGVRVDTYTRPEPRLRTTLAGPRSSRSLGSGPRTTPTTSRHGRLADCLPISCGTFALSRYFVVYPCGAIRTRVRLGACSRGWRKRSRAWTSRSTGMR